MSIEDVLRTCGETASWYGLKVVSIDQRNDFGDTPLHTVCSWGELEPIEALLAGGADINAIGEQGGTVLLRAVIGGNPSVIRFLLKNGADPTVKNDWGDTPLQYALAVSAPPEIIKLLRDATRAVRRG
jgi:uncharacterized protein